MASLQVVSERVVDDPQVQAPAPSAPQPAAPSVESSGNSLHMVALLTEIRRVLNARAGVLVAMLGSLLLTGWAVNQASWLSLLAALTFNVTVFLPIAYIAYLRPKE